MCEQDSPVKLTIDEDTLVRTCRALIGAGQKIDAIVLWGRVKQEGLLDAKFHIDNMADGIGPAEKRSDLLSRISELQNDRAALGIRVNNLDAELTRSQNEAANLESRLEIANARLAAVRVLLRAHAVEDVENLLGLNLE